MSQGSLKKLPWQYIIVDEGHRMKNAQSKFAQILGTVYQSRHRILLTGEARMRCLPVCGALTACLHVRLTTNSRTFG